MAESFESLESLLLSLQSERDANPRKLIRIKFTYNDGQQPPVEIEGYFDHYDDNYTMHYFDTSNEGNVQRMSDLKNPLNVQMQYIEGLRRGW